MRLVTLMALGATLAAAIAAADVRLEAEPRTFSLDGASGLMVAFPVGELSVEGDDGDDVRVSVRIRCRGGTTSDCQERARRVTIDHRISGGRLRLKFEGLPKSAPGFQVTARLLVPRALATRVEMGVGELDVRDMGAPLDLDLGVGDLSVHAAERLYRSARAETGIGDASVRTRSGTSRDRGFIGRSARWDDGNGSHAIKVHVGVGDATVSLR